VSDAEEPFNIRMHFITDSSPDRKLIAVDKLLEVSTLDQTAQSAAW